MSAFIITAVANTDRTVSVSLSIVNKSSGIPIIGATITATWSHSSKLSGWPYTQTSAASSLGIVSVVSKAGKSGADVTFQVTGVTAPGFVWNGLLVFVTRGFLNEQ